MTAAQLSASGTLLRGSMKSPATSHVMIRLPNWVGDAVMSVPALHELRRIFIDSRVTLVARPWVAGLFAGEGLADEIIHLSDVRGPFGFVRGFMRDARRLKRERFDIAVLLQNAFGAALLSRAAGVRKIIGYPTDGRRGLLDQVVPLERDNRTSHQVFYYLNIAANIERALTGKSSERFEGTAPHLSVSADQRDHARRFLTAAGVTIGGNGQAASAPLILALNPGATNSRAKRWPAERFAQAADRLSEKHGFQSIIIGSAGDLDVASEVAARMNSPAVVLAGQTSIAELKGVLSSASLVISNDTGTAHASAALGVPTVVVFGPTEHLTTRPLSDAAMVVRGDVECSPCMLRDCPIDHRCMTQVEVSDVCRAAESLWAAAERTRLPSFDNRDDRQ